MPRLMRWTAILAAGVIVTIAVAWLVVRTDWAGEQARRQIVTRVTAALDGTLTIGALEGSLLGDVVLRDVTLTQAGAPLLHADAVALRYSPRRLWREGIRINEVVLTRPAIAITERADGWNVAKLIKPRAPDGRPAPAFGIDRLQIVDGSVSVAPAGGSTRRAEAVLLDTSLLVADGRTAMTIASASGRDVDGATLDSLGTALVIGRGTWTASDLHARTSASAVDGRIAGTVSDGLNGLDFALTTAPLALADLAPYVAAIGSLPSDLLVTADAKGSDGEVRATWQVASTAGQATGTLSGRFSGGGFRGDGRFSATEVDLSKWLRDAQWASAIRSSGTFDVSLPASGAGTPFIAFDVTAPAVDLAGYRATSVAARGRYAAGKLSATASGTGYRTRVSTTVQWVERTRLTTFAGQFSGLDLRALPARLSIPALESNLSGRFDLAGGAAGWRAAATLDESTLEGATLAAGSIGSLDTTGADVAYGFDGPVSGLRPARVLQWIDDRPAIIDRLDEPINATIHVDARGASLAALDGRADVQLTSSRVLGIGIDRATVQTTIKDRALTSDIDAVIGDVSDQTLGIDAAGPFEGRGTATGRVRIPDLTAPMTLDTIDATLTMAVTSGRWRDMTITDALADASLATGTVTVRQLTATGPDVRLEASGRLAVAGSGESSLPYSLSLSSLASIQPLVGRPITGRAATTGTITGPAGSPTATGHLEASGIAVEQVKTTSTDLTYRVTLPNLDPANATSRIDGTASGITIDERAIERVTVAADVTPGRIDGEATAVQGSNTVTVTGMVLPQDGAVEAHLRRLDVAAEGTTWRLPDGQNVTVRYAADAIAVSGLVLVNGPARIGAEGTWGAGQTTPMTVTAERVLLETFRGLMPQLQQVSGTLDGTATIAGRVDAPTITVDATVRAGTVAELAFQSFGGTARYETGRLTLDTRLDAGNLGRLTVAGTMPLSLASAETTAVPYDLTAKSDAINLGFFQPLVPQVDRVSGTGRLDVRITGPASKPDLVGTVALTGATFRVLPTGVTYGNVMADFEVKGQQVLVNRFTADDGDGHIATIVGELQVPGVGPPSGVDLHLIAKNFHVLENEYGEIAVTVDLQFLGDFGTPLVSGTLSVDRGLIEASDLLDRLSARGYRPLPGAEAAAAEDTTFGRSSFSITLAMPDNVIVRGRDLRSGSGPLGLGNINVTVGGALSIAKDSHEPAIIVGNMDVVRGQYEFQGRRFNIRRGSEVRFTGAPANPTLNVDADRTISGVTANVHLGGTLARPAVVLTSTPPLDQGDILSLIVFGQAMNQLQAGERVSLANRAGALAASAVATPLADSVARALDLDMLEIRAPETARGGAAVVIGRQVSERLFVGFTYEFGADEASQVLFEYRVNEFMRIVTSLAQGGGQVSGTQRIETAGIDLIFIIR